MAVPINPMGMTIRDKPGAKQGTHPETTGLDVLRSMQKSTIREGKQPAKTIASKENILPASDAVTAQNPDRPRNSAHQDVLRQIQRKKQELSTDKTSHERPDTIQSLQHKLPMESVLQIQDGNIAQRLDERPKQPEVTEPTGLDLPGVKSTYYPKSDATVIDMRSDMPDGTNFGRSGHFQSRIAANPMNRRVFGTSYHMGCVSAATTMLLYDQGLLRIHEAPIAQAIGLTPIGINFDRAPYALAISGAPVQYGLAPLRTIDQLRTTLHNGGGHGIATGIGVVMGGRWSMLHAVVVDKIDQTHVYLRENGTNWPYKVHISEFEQRWTRDRDLSAVPLPVQQTRHTTSPGRQKKKIKR